MDRKENAIVVFSGGQDSTLCLGLALQKHAGNIYCITFDYGQRHAREITAAQQVIRHYVEATGRRIVHEVLPVHGFLNSVSPLTSKTELEQFSSYDAMAASTEGKIENTFVPMRNTLFLAIAANRAVEMGTPHIYTGVCQADYGGYPDCRASFISAFEEAVNESLSGTGSEIHIHTPLMDRSKANSVLLAQKTPNAYAALMWSHTAYDGAYPPIGRDHATLLRAHGFEEAFCPDPLVLRAVADGLMPLPLSPNYDVFRNESEPSTLGFRIGLFDTAAESAAMEKSNG